MGLAGTNGGTERRRSDRGVSMIEVLISVVLMGTAGVAVLAALGVAATGAATNHRMAEARSWLVSASDAVTAADYVECAVAADYQDDVDAALPDHDLVAVTHVEYWNGHEFEVSCGGERLQRITLRTTDSTGGDWVVVKRTSEPPQLGGCPARLLTDGSGMVRPGITPSLEGSESC